MSPRFQQALALAGLLHAVALVRRIARAEAVADDQLAIALDPVFALDAASVAEIYGPPAARHALLRVLKNQLGAGPEERDLEVTRFAATLMHLERKLVRRRDLMDTLRSGIQAAGTQREHFGLTHENTVGRLADLYARTISTLTPRVMVHGDPMTLAQPANTNRVRALLLAGMRSTVLWRQCRGNRLKLVLGRQRLLDAAAELDAG